MGRNEPLARATNLMPCRLGLPSRPGQEHLQTLGPPHPLPGSWSIQTQLSVSSEAYAARGWLLGKGWVRQWGGRGRLALIDCSEPQPLATPLFYEWF